MITVSKEYVERALDEIDKGGPFSVPRKRQSTKYCLVTRGRHYPPKYVLMQAHKLQTKTKPKGLRGGPPSNVPLEKLDYKIEKHCPCGNTCNFSN